MSVKVTRIHQIEVTTKCNLRCKYCPHPKMKRDKDHMSMETFKQAMEHVKYYDSLNLQPELSLTGMGESFLNPLFMDMCEYARSVYKGVILLSTNGLLVTEEIAEQLSRLNIYLYISLHRPEKAGLAVNIARKYNILADVNSQFATNAIDWAGQVDWEHTAPILPCAYLTKGWATVLKDGSVTTCCMDAEGLSVSGHVNDKIGSLTMDKAPLCDNCSMVLPDDL